METMEFKGTKGEWRVDKTAIKCNNIIIGFTATLISRVDETRLEGESWLDMRGRTKQDRIDCKIEEEANARLIAAAPDLLKALIPFTNFFEKDFDNSEFITITMEAKIADIIAAKQAIKKALL